MNTPTQYGPTQIPVLAPAAGEAVGDPLLTTLLSFFQAVANAYCITGWQAVSPKTRPIETTFAHDPVKEDFDTNDLPALYMWRTDEPTERDQVAEDIRVSRGMCSLLWVPAPATQEKKALRAPFAKALFDVLDSCMEQGIDPAWKVPGDAYPSADSVSQYGSVLFHHLPAIWRMYFSRAMRTNVAVQMATGGEESFDAWICTLNVEEELLRGFPTDTGTGLQLTVDSTETTPGAGDGIVLAARNEP